MPTELVAGKYIPLPVTLVPVGISFVAVAVPVVAKLVPSKVSAEPVANALVLLAYVTPLAVKLVKFVPPFAVGNVPLTWVVRPILPQLGAVVTPPDITAFPVATSASLDSVVESLAYNKSPMA